MNDYQEEMLRLISILARKLPQESLTEVNEQLRKIDHEYEKVEKALDKACDSLCSYDRFDDGWSAEQWKEWALENEN